jgi:ABC-type Zn uptake system ZnuABC Zn-binding protein ZnuA
MVKVARADIILKVGLELDMWIDRIIDGSRNSSLTLVDCSKYIEPLEVPTFKADARHGDLHRFGNPHYWLGPDNVPAIVQAVVEGLESVDPDNADYYRKRADFFLSALETDLANLRELAAPLQNREVVYYHNSWPYFNRYFGLKAVGFVEPYPGVPPSPSHMKDLTELVTERGVKVIALEPYFDRRIPEKIASGAGAGVITLYPSIGGRKKGETYTQWLEGNITALLEGLK